MNAKLMSDLLDRHLKAEYEGDLEATMATVGSNPEYYFPALDLRIKGREDIRAYYTQLFSSGFHHFDLKIGGRWICDEHTAIVESETTLTLTGSFLGTAFEGTRRVKTPQVSIVTFDTELISGERLYFDLASIQRQLGISPA